jgi:hypothetical protein
VPSKRTPWWGRISPVTSRFGAVARQRDLDVGGLSGLVEEVVQVRVQQPPVLAPVEPRSAGRDPLMGAVLTAQQVLQFAAAVDAKPRSAGSIEDDDLLREVRIEAAGGLRGAVVEIAGPAGPGDEVRVRRFAARRCDALGGQAARRLGAHPRRHDRGVPFKVRGLNPRQLRLALTLLEPSVIDVNGAGVGRSHAKQKLQTVEWADDRPYRTGHRGPSRPRRWVVVWGKVCS